MRAVLLVSLLLTVYSLSLKAQVLTAEDSLAAGLLSRAQATVLSGYGEARYTFDTRQKDARASLARVVLFVGHKFNNKISLFTEMELEDALVVGQSGDEGESGKGGISMEQAFIKFNLNPNTYLVAGLFIPRLGIINENHLPTTFNGVDRPFVEQLIIPSTWREVGIGLYGGIARVPGLNYSVGLTNGLNSSLFRNGSVIRNGRQLGSGATGMGLGLSGSLLYYTGHFRVQASAWMGGSTAVSKRVADSLHLNHGAFGNPVMLGEINAQYSHQAWNIRAIVTGVSVPNALNINKAYANNTPKSAYGGYLEGAYDLFWAKHQGAKSCWLFGRYEYMDLSAKMPSVGLPNPANRQQYIVGGITFKPIRGIAVKADWVQRITGTPNPDLVITPFPQQVPYYTSNGFFNLGIAYNF